MMRAMVAVSDSLTLTPEDDSYKTSNIIYKQVRVRAFQGNTFLNAYAHVANCIYKHYPLFFYYINTCHRWAHYHHHYLYAYALSKKSISLHCRLLFFIQIRIFTKSIPPLTTPSTSSSTILRFIFTCPIINSYCCCIFLNRAYFDSQVKNLNIDLEGLQGG